MDYEKAYNEALERANKFYEANTDEGYRQIFEEIFPELKESEDEKIRKELIDFLDDVWHLGKNAHFDKYGKADCADWIAWLERLGDKAFSVERLFAEAGIKPAYKDGDSWCVLIGENIQEGICGFGETPRHAYVNFLKELWNRAFQPPVRLKPEFKPKFKVGDFVLHGKKNIIFQVEKTFLDKTYRIVPIDADKGKAVTSATEDTLRLWTIEDAKDGDVLAEHETIVLFKTIEGLNIKCYCTYHYLGYNPTLYVDTLQNKEPYRPAAKEQRDLLFQKMEEAGYELDAEKKELRKIEQNPAWSEEDEKIHRKCICAMRATACGFPEEEKFVEQVDNWLNSLKERYTWKPSDEQLHYLSWIANIKLGDGVVEQEVSKHLNKLYDDLKKLKG